MGMRWYPENSDYEFKYSWPLSEAIADAIPEYRLEEMLNDYYIELSKDDVARLIGSIYEMFSNGITDKVSCEGFISGQYALKVAHLGICLDHLIRWHSDACEDATIHFG